MRSTCHVPRFSFSLDAVLEIQRSQFFPFFPTWLLHHVTSDVKIIIKKNIPREQSLLWWKFCVNPTKRLQRKTVLTFCADRQTDPNGIHSRLARVTNRARVTLRLDYFSTSKRELRTTFWISTNQSASLCHMMCTMVKPLQASRFITSSISPCLKCFIHCKNVSNDLIHDSPIEPT